MARWHSRLKVLSCGARLFGDCLSTSSVIHRYTVNSKHIRKQGILVACLLVYNVIMTKCSIPHVTRTPLREKVTIALSEQVSLVPHIQYKVLYLFDILHLFRYIPTVFFQES